MSREELLEELIGAIAAQATHLGDIGFAYMGVVLVTWGSVYGLSDNMRISHFQYPLLLALPFLLFLICTLLGYVTSMQIAGFAAEFTAGVTSQGSPIDSSMSEFFFKEYHLGLQLTSGFQILSLILGVLGLGGWFVYNIWWLDGRPHGNARGGSDA